MMGADGLKYATEVALLNANWLAHKIEDSFKVLYKGENGRVAHECIFDCRNLPVTAEDIATVSYTHLTLPTNREV